MDSATQSLKESDLPAIVWERVCQYLLDDPKENHPWCSPGFYQVMNLRLTNNYFNQVVKDSCLRFSLFIDYFDFSAHGKLRVYYDQIKNFFKWAKSNSNWKCTELKLISPMISDERNLFTQQYISSLTQFDSVFSKQISRLVIDCGRNFFGCGELQKALSNVMSQNAHIELKAEIKSFKDLADIPFLNLIKGLQFRGTDFSLDEPVVTAGDVTPNLEHVVLRELDANALVALRSAVKLQKLTCSDCPSILETFYSKLDGAHFDHIQHLSFENLRGMQILQAPFAKTFPSLTSLSIGAAAPGKYKSLALPPTCKTVRLDISLLHTIKKCPQVKNLMIIDSEDFDRSLTRMQKLIPKFTFQLEIFGITGYYDEEITVGYYERLVLSLLDQQGSLKAISINFPFPTDSSIEIEFDGDDSFLEWTKEFAEEDIEAFARKEENLLRSHPSLQYLRILDWVVVLKNSIDEDFCRLIKLLDTEHGWTIAQFHNEGGLAFRKFSFTIV